MIEVDFLVERLVELGTDIKMQKEFDTAVGSIINNLLFGYRFDEEHQHEFETLKKALRDLIVIGSSPLLMVAIFVPMTRSWPGFKGVILPILGTFDNFMSHNQVLMDFIERQIEERRKQIDLKSEGYDDFVECYLKEREKKRGTPNEQFYCETQLVNTVLDIWTAGMETTSNTLTWTICYVLNHPEVQERIHEELDRVIGSDRKITLADKNALPYVNAVVSEVQRLANLLPQNLMRLTNEDVEIRGFKIRKGTAIVPQIATVLYDEKVFPDPYKFDPSRFIAGDGSLRTYPELVPFSVGKRQCVGEGLAKMELYLFIANIFQRFKITSNQLPSMEKGAGQVVTAKEYLCNFQDRFLG